MLDLGCGSGLVLLGAAQRLPSGAATGVDLWRSRDQAGSNRALCLDNARLLGVQDRVTLVDGDMTELQIPDASFDLVLACLAIHNLHPPPRREQAVLEDAVRREVAEEAGVSVGAVTYVASQAWPFPSGLMLGFRATAASEAVTVDGEELLEARWFTRAELAEHAASGGRLGREDSIDRLLLRSWLEERDD